MTRRPFRLLALCLILALATLSAPAGTTGSAGMADRAQAPAPAQATLGSPFTKSELYGLGALRTFEGATLRELAFPLGGIGTGTVSLGGRGNLRDWEIFNRPGKGVDLPFTFFSLYCRRKAKHPSSGSWKGACTRPSPARTACTGPRCPACRGWRRRASSASIPSPPSTMTDGKLPLEVTLEAFNPFVPLNVDDSGIPVVVLRYRLKNLSAKRVQATVAGSLFNPVGFDGEGKITGIGHAKLGQNVNQVRTGGALNGLFMTSKKVDPTTSAAGNVALTTPWKDVTYLSHWVRGDWFDDLQIFWDDFAADGTLKNETDASPSPDGRSDVGTLGARWRSSRSAKP